MYNKDNSGNLIKYFASQIIYLIADFLIFTITYHK